MKYIVRRNGQKSVRLTPEQIAEQAAAGNLSADATVSVEGSTFQKPILIFLGEAHQDQLQNRNPRRRRWPFWILSLAVVLTVSAAAAAYVAMEFKRQLRSQLIDLHARLEGLEDSMEGIAGIQGDRANGGLPFRKPAQIINDRPQPMVSEAAWQADQIRGAIKDYQNLIQQLGRDPDPSGPGRVETSEAIEQLMRRLDGLGIASEPGGPGY